MGFDEAEASCCVVLCVGKTEDETPSENSWSGDASDVESKDVRAGVRCSIAQTEEHALQTSATSRLHTDETGESTRAVRLVG